MRRGDGDGPSHVLIQSARRQSHGCTAAGRRRRRREGPPRSEFPIVPSYPHYPHSARGAVEAHNLAPSTKWLGCSDGGGKVPKRGGDDGGMLPWREDGLSEESGGEESRAGEGGDVLSSRGGGGDRIFLAGRFL